MELALAMILPGSPQSSSGPALDEAGAIVGSLLVAVKTHSLYPEEYATCREALVRLGMELQTFLASEGELLLQVQQDRLLWNGEVLLAEPAREGNISFVLFRDGIQWFPFERGIDPSENSQYFLSVRSGLWSTLGGSHLERLTGILLALTPETIPTLAPLLSALESRRIVRLLTEIVCRLARQDPAPDDYTYSHSVNVAVLSLCLGNCIDLSRPALEQIGLVAKSPKESNSPYPKVMLLKRDDAGALQAGDLVEPGPRDPHQGASRRRVIRTLNPGAYGIQAADFLLP